MRFLVVPTRQRGIPRLKREISAADGLVGDVVTSYQQDMFLRHTVLVATFSDARADIHERAMLPGLFDARCVLIAPEGIMLTGIECVQIDSAFVEYAQGWWLRPAEAQVRQDYLSVIAVPRRVRYFHNDPAREWMLKPAAPSDSK